MTRKLRAFAARYLLADAAPLSTGERWRSTIAVLLGMLLIEVLLFVTPGDAASRHLLAPLGATSVILFALPHSPLGQPWPTAGGLVISALVGMICQVWITPNWLAIAVALAVAVWLMASLRCIHPPGGAMAVLFASGFGSDLGAASGLILSNTLAVLFAALAINAAIPGRRWPQCIPVTPGQRPQRQVQRPGINHDDLQYALNRIDGFLDITEDDLVQVYELAVSHACERHETRSCGDTMTRPVARLSPDTPLDEAWQLLRQHPVKALPVVDGEQHVLGMIGADDFLHHVAMDGRRPIGDHLRRLLSPGANPLRRKVERVGQIMSLPDVIATIDDPISRVANQLCGQQHHAAVPVVDADGKLVGMLCVTDLLAALYHRHATRLAAGQPAA